MVSEWQLQNYIQFIGFVDDTPTLLNSVHLLLHTSGKETFGRVFVEAMACKIPVIAAKGGSADEVIENGVTGFTFNKDDIIGASSKIIELLENNDLYTKIAEASRKQVVQKYGLEKLSISIQLLYQKILNEKSENK